MAREGPQSPYIAEFATRSFMATPIGQAPVSLALGMVMVAWKTPSLVLPLISWKDLMGLSSWCLIGDWRDVSMVLATTPVMLSVMWACTVTV